MIDTLTAQWEAVAAAIRDRRSNLNVDLERAVPRETIDELIELATWAPNHYRTNPWRFVVLTGDARRRVGEVAAEAISKQPDVKDPAIERQRGQFLRAPAVLIAASARDEDPIKDFENKHSVAAGVQNLLLGATALGLASAWRSGAAMVDPEVGRAVKDAVDLDQTDEIVAFVYLGYPTAPPGTREKPPADVRYVDA